VYEWLPYNDGYDDVPSNEQDRFEWLKGMNVTAETTDAEILAAGRGYAIRFARVAARFRRELIEKYGEEQGSRIRFAEAFELCEYGRQPSEVDQATLFLAI